MTKCRAIILVSLLIATVVCVPQETRRQVERRQSTVATPTPAIRLYRKLPKRQNENAKSSGGDGEQSKGNKNDEQQPGNSDDSDEGAAANTDYSSTTTVVVTQTAAGGGSTDSGDSKNTIIYIVAGVAGGLVLLGGIIYYLRRDKDAGDWFKHLDLPWGDKEDSLPPSMQQQPTTMQQQPSQFQPPVPQMPMMPMGDPFGGAAGPQQQQSLPPGQFPPEPFMNQPAPNALPPPPQMMQQPGPTYSYDSYDSRSQVSYDPTVHHDRAASEHTAMTSWKGAPTEALTSISQRYNPDGTLKQKVIAPRLMIQGADEHSMRSLTSGRSLGSTRSGTSRRYSGFTWKSGKSGGSYKTARSLNSSKSGTSQLTKSLKANSKLRRNSFEEGSINGTDYSWKSFKTGSRYAPPPSVSRSYRSSPSSSGGRSGRTAASSKKGGPSGHYYEEGSEASFGAGTDLSFEKNSIISARTMGSRLHGNFGSSAFTKASSSLKPHEDALLLSNSDFSAPSQFKAQSSVAPLAVRKGSTHTKSDGRSLSESDYSYKSGTSTKMSSRSKRSPPPAYNRSEAITGFTSSSAHLKPVPLSGSDVGTSLFQPPSSAPGLRNAANKTEVKAFMRNRLVKPLSGIVEGSEPDGSSSSKRRNR